MDGDLNFRCRNREAVNFMHSTHSIQHADRQFDFSCSNVNLKNPIIDCFLSPNPNALDKPVDFVCPDNYVLTGVLSYHSNPHHDRVFAFRCCKSCTSITSDCVTTDYLNSFTKEFTFETSSQRFFVGILSYHSNGYR